MLNIAIPLRLLPFLIGFVMLWGYPQSGLPTSLPEYQVKAVLIYKITKFIEWPEQSDRDTDSTLNVCVLGEDPFGENLDLIHGKTVRDRVLLIHKFDNLKSAYSGCHVVFISASEAQRVRSILKVLNTRPVLTIGDTEGFAEAGSIVNFINKNNKIRFEINLDASRKAGLKMSSQLLELATIVDNNHR